MDESFERAMEPQPVKRKRSSILKPAEKRASRDSRTVSFNDRYVYKELHQDGTCDITNLFLREDLDVINNQTINSSMSMDQGSMISIDTHHNSTLAEDTMIDVEASLTETHNNSIQMDLTLISQFMNTMPKINSIELSTTANITQTNNYEASTLYDKEMSLASDITTISSLDSCSVADQNIDVGQNVSVPANNPGLDISANETTESTESTRSAESSESVESTVLPQHNGGSTTMLNCSIGRLSEMSSFNTSTLKDQSLADETFYGAFHDSNEISIQTSGMDSIMKQVDALEERVQLAEEHRNLLDDELEDLLKFYRHIVNPDNKYEFALRIFGLRHGLWLIFNVNPETYPAEKLDVKFAVNKKDRTLYPFPEYAEALSRCTREGRKGYLTRFIINAQKFRRFLRLSGYRKANKD